MTIAITGSSGFLGKALVSYLLKRQHKLVLLLHDESLRKPTDDLIVIRYNSLDEEKVISETTKHKCDAFVHLAWKGVSGEDRNKDFQLNYNVNLALQSVHLAHEAGIKQWIGTGSQAEYGIVNTRISESDNTLPLTEYGKAKLIAGRKALELCREFGMNGVWNRIFSLYGTRDNPRYLIPYLIDSFSKSLIPSVTKCEQVWDYLYVDDAAEAICRQIETGANDTFNLCSGKEIVLKEVVEIIHSHFPGSPVAGYGSIPYSSDQVMHLSGSCDKLLRFCGWKPSTSLEDGILKTIEYYRKHESV